MNEVKQRAGFDGTIIRDSNPLYVSSDVNPPSSFRPRVASITLSPTHMYESTDDEHVSPHVYSDPHQAGLLPDPIDVTEQPKLPLVSYGDVAVSDNQHVYGHAERLSDASSEHTDNVMPSYSLPKKKSATLSPVVSTLADDVTESVMPQYSLPKRSKGLKL